ncbi:MAG: ion transporter [Spirochaetota bacterium]
MNENSYLGRSLERVIFILVVLVILQTFWEEFAVFMGYSLRVRKYLLIASLGFDLLFSIEFVSRLIVSGRKAMGGHYMAYEGGVADLLASLPLLLFHSLPLVYIMFFSTDAGLLASVSGLSTLQAAWIISLAGLLRFVRVLKIFGKLRTLFRMTPRYLYTGTAVFIAVVIASLAGFSCMDRGTLLQSASMETRKILANYIKSSQEHDFESILGGSSTVLIIKKDDIPVYRSISRLDFDRQYSDNDYDKSTIGSYEIYFSTKDANRTRAFINMLAFSAVLGSLLGMVVLYRRHFNRHISGTTAVMLRGFRNAGYLTPVRINDARSDFEIYQLADQYNRKWLPLKRKILEIRGKQG